MNHLKNVAKNPLFWVAVLYLLLPVDIIPDIVPVAGVADDVVMFILSSLLQSKISGKSKQDNDSDF